LLSLCHLKSHEGAGKIQRFHPDISVQWIIHFFLPLFYIPCPDKSRKSDIRDEATSVHCTAGRKTMKLVSENHALFSDCASFWNVFLLDLA